MITSLLTPDDARLMTVQELLAACAKQVDVQHPGITDDQHKDFVVELFTSIVTDQQKDALAEDYFMSKFDEVHMELLEATATRLMHPEIKDGSLYGYLGVRDAGGEELIVRLQYATVEDFDAPYHPQHRLAYRAVAERLKGAGATTYADGYSLGLFGSEERS